MGEAGIVQIKIISQIISRVLKNSVGSKPILNNWQAVLDYAYATLKNLNYEVFRVLFLDKNEANWYGSNILCFRIIAVPETSFTKASSIIG